MPRYTSQELEVRLQQAHTLYVQSPANPRLEDVAAMFDISMGTIKERCAEGRWKDERTAFQTKLATLAQEKHVPLVAEEIARLRTKSFELIETAMDVMQHGLEDGTLRWSNPKQAGETITMLLAGLRETGFLGATPLPDPTGKPGSTTTNNLSIIGMVAAMPGVSVRADTPPTIIDALSGVE